MRLAHHASSRMRLKPGQTVDFFVIVGGMEHFAIGKYDTYILSNDFEAVP